MNPKAQLILRLADIPDDLANCPIGQAHFLSQKTAAEVALLGVIEKNLQQGHFTLVH